MSEIRCNRCGRIIVFGDMHNKEDYVLIQKEWGYFSRKDGRKYTLRMCEDCYDRLVNECVIPPRIDDVTEYAWSMHIDSALEMEIEDDRRMSFGDRRDDAAAIQGTYISRGQI